MTLLEYDYEPTDFEDELFLSDVPVSVIQESIITQFNYPLEYRKKDYVQTFITQYEINKGNMLEDDLTLLEVTRERFLGFLMNIFYEYLYVGFDDDKMETMEEEDQNELIHLTYRFFIKNIKKNFVNVILNYINEHENDISERFEKKRDVTSLNFKLEIDNDYDILVLSNMGDIIQYIIDEVRLSDDVDQFLRLCETDEVVLELVSVKNAFENLTLTGNFIESYINMIDDDDFMIEIQSKVRNKILKKYPNRVKKVEIETDTNDNDLNDDYNEDDNIEE